VDSFGNDLKNGGLTVVFALGNGSGSTGKGTFSAVTDHMNGTYTATFTGTIAGSNTIVATINGLKLTSTPASITVTPGAVSLAKSIVMLSKSSVGIGGTLTATLQAKDASGNDLTTGGLVVLFLLEKPGGGQGNFTATTDNENGTYTATFDATAAGSNLILATIGDKVITSSLPTIKVT
jgi:adhesin/invasin